MKGKILLLLLLLSFSCNENGIETDLVDLAFGDAIEKIDDISTSWQETLKELEAEIANQVDETIRGPLIDLVQSSIASAGIEFRCNYNFLRTGIKKDLTRLRNKWRAKRGLSQFAIEKTPEVCHIIPNAIKPEDQELIGVGFDLVKEDLDFILISNDGSRRNIDNYITSQSNYQFTILFGGANGLPFAPTHQKIIIECSACATVKVISEIPFNIPPVIQEFGTLYGGQEGVAFTDEPDIEKVKKISALRIRHSNFINALAVAWEEYGDPADTSRYKWSVYRGGSGGVDTIISLDWDEYLTGYALRAGARIDQIKFKTNKREIGPFGGGGGQSYFDWNAGNIVGFYGRAGAYQTDQYLYALGIVVRK